VVIQAGGFGTDTLTLRAKDPEPLCRRLPDMSQAGSFSLPSSSLSVGPNCRSKRRLMRMMLLSSALPMGRPSTASSMIFSRIDHASEPGTTRAANASPSAT